MQFSLSLSKYLNANHYNYRPRSRGDNTFGSVHPSVSALTPEPFNLRPWFMERGSTLTLARLGSKVTKYQGHLVVKCVLSSYFDMIFLTPELFFLLVHSGRYWYLALHSISAFFLEQNMVSTWVGSLLHSWTLAQLSAMNASGTNNFCSRETPYISCNLYKPNTPHWVRV